MPMESVSSAWAWYDRHYKALSPTADSERIAASLLSGWAGNNHLADTEKIIVQARGFEAGFFRDIINFCEAVNGPMPGGLRVAYFNFALNSYNYYAFSASDGYIVLADDLYTRTLFFLSLVLLMDTQNQVPDHEQDTVRAFAREFLAYCVIGRRDFSFAQNTTAMSLLARDAEVAEMANYFFYSVLAFILLHEIGHHYLGHTRGVTKAAVATGHGPGSIIVDERSWQNELDADAFAGRCYLQLVQTVDDRYKYAFFKYRYDYAPVILFKIFDKLDMLHSRVGKPVRYTTHPPPLQRLEALKRTMAMHDDYPLCKHLESSLDWLL